MKTSPTASPDPRNPPPGNKAPPVALLRVLGFFSGGSVMIVEFSGNRLLAPTFGNSLYTWTGLIGVILLALSFGDYIGGWLVDRSPRLGILPVLFALGGVLTAAIPLLAPAASDAVTTDLVWGPVKESLCLFFLPGLTLASITPVAIRLLSKALADASIGKSAGTVGMASALGSLVGTMGTSYVLIPAFGVRAILFMLGGFLLALGLALAWLWRSQALGKGFLATLTVVGAIIFWRGSLTPAVAAGVIYQEDTFYHRIEVLDRPAYGSTTRILKLDTTFEGAQVMETGELLFDYQHYWRLAEVFCPHLKNALFLGAGAFGMPERLSARYPSAAVDVVEIDPKVIDVGRQFFRLDDFPGVTAHAADARHFLQSTPARYDFIFGDAYNGVQYIPAHLVTREFFSDVGKRLAPQGVYVMNLIGSIQGGNSRLFWGVFNGLAAVFPSLQVYAPSQDPTMTQNLIIVASRGDLKEAADGFLARAAGEGDREALKLLGTRLELPAPPPPRMYFTDDYNPVEYIVANQLRND